MARRKPDNLTSMLDNLGTEWLSQRLISLIDDRHYEVVSNLSPVDPTFYENIFKRLRDAVIQKDAQKVNEVKREIGDFDDKLTRVRQIMRDTKAVLDAFPEVYGGGDEQ